MWILKILPDFVFHIILIVGLLGLGASFVLKRIPFFAQNGVLVQVVASILIAIGIYMEGAISNNNAWKARVSDLEKQIAVAEAKSNAANTELVTKIAQKDREIQAKQAELNKRVQSSATKIDSQCTVSSDVISILNDAAKKPGATK